MFKPHLNPTAASLRLFLYLPFWLATAGHAMAETVATQAPPVVFASRWQSSMAAFDAADREKPPAEGGVLFVGSSTIRLWSSLAQDFRHLPVVINRGFGGSTMADCDHLSRQLVTRYRPRQVLVYAGDNDLAEGRTPAQVLESFAHFVQVVRSELPGTRIAYISIKPSPSRAALMPRIRDANTLVSNYVRTLENAEYIDIFTPMLTASGDPRPELFRADQLHMNDQGYALWQGIISRHLPVPIPLTVTTPAPLPPAATAAAGAAAAALAPARLTVAH